MSEEEEWNRLMVAIRSMAPSEDIQEGFRVFRERQVAESVPGILLDDAQEVIASGTLILEESLQGYLSLRTSQESFQDATIDRAAFLQVDGRSHLVEEVSREPALPGNPRFLIRMKATNKAGENDLLSSHLTVGASPLRFVES